MNEETMIKPEGKGMAVTGFVLSLVTIVFSAIVFGIVVINVAAGGGLGLGYFWLLLCIASVAFSLIGMLKLGKTGGKKGLAIAGLIIGFVATIWSLMLLLGVNSAVEEAKAGSKDFNDAMEQLDDAMKNN